MYADYRWEQQLVPDQFRFHDQAARDLWQIRYCFRSTQKRKGPPWSLPVEIRTLITNPSWRHTRHPPGEGSNTGQLHVPHGTDHLTSLITLTHRTGAAPLIAHRSHVNPIGNAPRKVHIVHKVCLFRDIGYAVFFKRPKLLTHWAHNC